MLSIKNLKNEIKEKQLIEIINESLREYKKIHKVLIVHPDYTRFDFTNKLAPLILKTLRERNLKELHFLCANGTHRKMTELEFHYKLGIHEEKGLIFFYNHEFDCPERLAEIGEIPSNFVSEKTNGFLTNGIPITINKLVLDENDLIIVISSTTPHEASGYSGGLKTFSPGISGPEVIDLFHWAATLIGIPEIIGNVNNPAREIINLGSSFLFNRDAPMLSFNMVADESDMKPIPKGLFVGAGYDGFIEAYEEASMLSSKLHVKYIEKPINTAVQEIPRYYDEIWTAAKGSYKLQKPGVISKNGEIIIFAPHVKCFHSNPTMNKYIMDIGYHCKEYVHNFLESNPNFCRNVAAHVINFRGTGHFNKIIGSEEFAFKLTLATGIPKDICRAVGLNYKDPNSINREDYCDSDRIWIQDGGKYLFDLKKKMKAD